MCGRYTLTSPDELVEEFGLGEMPFVFTARYNIAPSNEVPVIVSGAQGTEARLLRWGLLPRWVRDSAGAKRPINARVETVHEKPSFREAFERRRCLVCADGILEWRRQGGRPMPHLMRRRDRRLVGFAGIWESHMGSDGEVTQSFAILTTNANALMSPIHDRMPIVIAPNERERWLAPAPRSRADLEDLLVAPPSKDYEVFQVSEKVNSVANDSEACIAAGPDQLSLFSSLALEGPR